MIDVTALLGARRTLRDVQALLELGASSIDRVREALARNVAAPGVPLANVRLRSPVLQPPTVRDFMIYEEHATDQGTRTREEAWYRMPIFYFSNTLRIYGPDDHIPFPSASDQLDYELELGCIIGREGSNVSEADAFSYIAGFCIFNDWSCRDIQRDESAVGLGPAKGKDSATSLGPWMVTTDEMAPYLRDGRLHVNCNAKVNGDFWLKDSDGGASYHTFGSLVERASRDSRIVPGDVFGTGTVGGGSVAESVRKGYEKARFLQPGDVVEFEVEGIGVLRGTIDPKVNADPDYRYRAKELRSEGSPETTNTSQGYVSPLDRVDVILDRETQDHLGQRVTYQVPISAYPTKSGVVIVNSPGSGELKDGRRDRWAKLARHLQEREIGTMVTYNAPRPDGEVQLPWEPTPIRAPAGTDCWWTAWPTRSSSLWSGHRTCVGRVLPPSTCRGFPPVGRPWAPWPSATGRSSEFFFSRPTTVSGTTFTAVLNNLPATSTWPTAARTRWQDFWPMCWAVDRWRPTPCIYARCPSATTGSAGPPTARFSPRPSIGLSTVMRASLRLRVALSSTIEAGSYLPGSGDFVHHRCLRLS